ncbi:acyltransferase family protein [Corynebacterium anserum]|uniref:acyltransferase family protein n=1 Tax=Corynebacterium anserum TaxID=2684406 RepID=UPI00163FFD53|nr:acyltransferase family protein [Corynebacterium anserum]
MSRQRVDWADSAKGLSIIGVCLMHVVTGVDGGTLTAWGHFSTLLDPLRMPLFFLVSGLFSHRVITRDLTDLWYRRLWFLLVPYLIYTPVQAAIRLDFMEELTASNLIKAIIVGDPGLWFLYTLMLYNIAAVLLRHQPPWLALLISTVPLFVGCMSGAVMEQGYRQAMMYAPIFFAGLHYRQVIFTVAAKASHVKVVVSAFVVFALWELIYRGLEFYYFQGWDEKIAGETSILALVRTFTAVPLGIIIAVWISHTPVLSTFVNFVGRNTLPIYVSHHAALTFTNTVIVPWMAEQTPGMAEALASPHVSILLGLATCVVSGAVFYFVGKTPILKWTLFPPALPRRRTHSASMVKIQG